MGDLSGVFSNGKSNRKERECQSLMCFMAQSDLGIGKYILTENCGSCEHFFVVFLSNKASEGNNQEIIHGSSNTVNNHAYSGT